MADFKQTIGIDYSGAKTPKSRIKGLRVYDCEDENKPREVSPTSNRAKYWNRIDVAHWLIDQLAKDKPILVGIDHGFSFPLEYFETFGLEHDWQSFLDDFQSHWPTDDENTYVDFVREGIIGNGAAREGSSLWRRETEIRTRAKSVFHFDVPGQVAKSTHAGIPWLRFIRSKNIPHVHFWPFDGWDVPKGYSAILEVYPALWSHNFARENRDDDQHDAFTIAAQLSRADRDGCLRSMLATALSPDERARAKVEGWILGVAPA